jgi:S1-C subfamily serine protease
MLRRWPYTNPCSPDGYILTNNHVVEGAIEITVTLSDKREFKAHTVGTDPRTDIAVLKISASGLPGIVFGDSSKVRVGDIALAIGSPFGLSETNGALLGDVDPDGPAGKSGLEKGDIVLEMNGKLITDTGEFRLNIAMMKPGTTINLKVFRFHVGMMM